MAFVGSFNIQGSIGPAAYKVYTALLTQTGENHPVVTVLENTIDPTLTWIRDDLGTYIMTSPSYGFTEGKTWCVLSQRTAFVSEPFAAGIQWDNAGQIEIVSGWGGQRADNVLFNNCVEIRIYP